MALNQCVYKPVISGTCSRTYMGVGGVLTATSTEIAPAGADKLAVKVIDTLSTPLEVHDTSVGAGGTTLGHHLARNATALNGGFVTGLRPFDVSGNPVNWSIHNGAPTAGGQKVIVYLPLYNVTALFRTPGATSVNGPGFEVVGDVGVLARGSSHRNAVQLLNGTRFTESGDDLATANYPVSIGLAWSEGPAPLYPRGISGWLERETGNNTQITIDTGSVSAASVTQVRLNGAPVFFSTPGSNTVRFTATADGSISISASTNNYSPRSFCEGQ